MRRSAILLAALTLMAAGCGDDDGSVLGEPGTTAAPTQATGGDGGAATTTTAATASETTEAAPGVPGGSNGGLQTALLNSETAAIRAVYRFGDGADEQIVTIARDPGLDPPVSATLIGPDGDEGRFLTIGERTLICGAPGDDCIEFPSNLGMDMGQALLGPVLSGFLLNEDLESNPGFTVEEGTATIGGRRGLCFTFNPMPFVTGADVESIRQCVDAELGFILLIETLEAGGTTAEQIMELLEFGLPTPADFEPSGPVTTMPGG